MIDWENYRNMSGELNLIEAFKHIHVVSDSENSRAALDFLQTTMDLRPIVSRQVAAVALSYAAAIAGGALD